MDLKYKSQLYRGQAFSSLTCFSAATFSLTTSLRLLLACLAMYASAPTQAQTGASAVLSLDEAVAIALAENPGLASTAAEAKALAEVPEQAGALPDPMLSFNAMNLPTDTFDLDQEPMTQLQVILSQRLPFPGKRQLRSEAAGFKADAARLRSEEMRDQLTGYVRRDWWQLFAADRALDIIETNRALLEDLVETARSRYAVGKGLQQDVLLAELELSRLLERRARVNGRRNRLQASLNGWLDRSPDTPAVLSSVPPSETLPDPGTETTLINSAMAKRDLVGAMAMNLEAAEKQLALAEKERLPDFNIGLGYADRRGEDPLRGNRTDFVSLMVSINLPVYASRKQHRAISQKAHERELQASRLLEVKRRVSTDIGSQLADYQAARAQALLLKGTIIPQAEQTVAAMLAGYQVNKVDFLNVVNGQVMLYNASINYWRALADAKQALAGLAAATGEESLYE